MTQLPILLVDDEDGIRTVLSISLMDRGHDVDTAPDVDTALSLFSQNRHPIVLTDIKMPGKSGIDLLKAVKETAPETEVIMITGHGDMELAIQSLKHDAFDFITKPINDEVLGFALDRAAERISMRNELADHTRNLERLVEEKSAQLVEAERRAAACQLFDGLTASLSAFTDNLDGLSVFNQMPLFVSIHNRKGEVVSVNAHYRERLGELTGKPSWTMYEDLDDPETDCPVCRTLASGQPERSDQVVHCASGNRLSVVVDTVPITGATDSVEMVLEFMVDLHEMEHLREELRRTRHKYQQLFDQSPCYISVQDTDLTITSANAQYKNDFGEFQGDLCFKRLMHRRSPCPDCPLLKSFEDGKSHQLETVVTDARGEKHNILIWSAPIRDENGEVTQAIEMITDITRIRKLQDRLTSLGLLLGSTAHGIKGLLTGIDGAIYRLGSGIEKKDFGRMEDGFKDLEFLTDRVKTTVLDILYYAKKRELNWKELNLQTFTTDLYAAFVGKAKAKDVILDLDMAGNLGSFKADGSILASALGNIIENGIDACAGNHDDPDDPPRVTLKAYSDDDQVAFRISDNGVGMDRETRDKLFTLFFSSKGTSGTGIGLFVASEIASQHGGSITVESEPGEGSSFTVVIPKELPVNV